MGEWRVFIERREKDEFDLWQTLNIPVTETTPTQKRSDLYLAATNDVGVKFRGEGSGGPPLLEVKVRLKRKKRGAEKWAKVMCAHVDANVATFGAMEFRKVLTKEGLLSGHHAPYLQAVLAAWERAPPVQLLLTKERRQRSIGRLVVEQTDFVVNMNGKPLGNPLGYRTINMEAQKASKIYKLLASSKLVPAVLPSVYLRGCANHTTCNIKTPGSDSFGCVTAGFPQFVLHIAQRYLAPPATNGSSSSVPTQPLEPGRSC